MLTTISKGREMKMQTANKSKLKALQHRMLVSAVAVTSLFLPLCPLKAQQAAPLPEPEYAATVYWLDSAANKLVPLERKQLNAAAKAKAFGFGGIKATMEVTGPKSQVRFPVGQKLEFVVRAPQDLDPQTLAEIVTLTVKKNHRELTYVESKGVFGLKGAKGQGDASNQPFEAVKYGQSSIKITPAAPLNPGEYAIRAPNQAIVFCFGVDPK
jgi:hypothetical protein